MKYSKITLFVFVLLAIAGCKKDNPTAPEHKEPGLASMMMHFFRHDATDSVPTIPHGISVHLYSSLSDLNNNSNQIGATLTPDSFGQIPFPVGLEKKTYYWWAEINNSCIYDTGSVDVSTNTNYSV